VVRGAVREGSARREERQGEKHCRQYGETPHQRHSRYALLPTKAFTAFFACSLAWTLAYAHGEARRHHEPG
jgi:hypothetical protein